MCASLISLHFTVNRVTCLETDQNRLKNTRDVFVSAVHCMLQILNASYALGKDVNFKEFHILSVEEYYGRV